MEPTGRDDGLVETVQQFVDLLERTFTLADLKRHLTDIVKDMGFQHFSMTHHVDLRNGNPGENVALTDYPEEFVETYLTNKMYTSDPVVLASCHKATGFRWSELGQIITIRGDSRQIFDLSTRAGLSDGYAVPVHLPGEANGACVFATATGHSLPQKRDFMAQLVGRYAFEGARRIIRKRDRVPKPGADPKLTTRQRDCVLLVARGYSNNEIAEELGIRPRTVEDYVEEARRRYGARNRTHLSMHAVFDGTFSLNDVLR
jgi:LuxR family transcriptional regulator, quorum-sensing system regulator CciR